MERILSLDLALAHTGVAVIDVGPPEVILHTQVIHTFMDATCSPATLMIRRAGELFTGLLELIIEWRPDLVVAEVPHGGSRSSHAASCMAAAHGVYGALSAMFDDIHWVLPTDAKGAATDNKFASKVDVELAIINTYVGYKWPKSKGDRPHIMDAISAWMAYREQLNHVT